MPTEGTDTTEVGAWRVHGSGEGGADIGAEEFEEMLMRRDASRICTEVVMLSTAASKYSVATNMNDVQSMRTCLPPNALRKRLSDAIAMSEKKTGLRGTRLTSIA